MSKLLSVVITHKLHMRWTNIRLKNPWTVLLFSGLVFVPYECDSRMLGLHFHIQGKQQQSSLDCGLFSPSLSPCSCFPRWRAWVCPQGRTSWWSSTPRTTGTWSCACRAWCQWARAASANWLASCSAISKGTSSGKTSAHWHTYQPVSLFTQPWPPHAHILTLLQHTEGNHDTCGSQRHTRNTTNGTVFLETVIIVEFSWGSVRGSVTYELFAFFWQARQSGM